MAAVICSAFALAMTIGLILVRRQQEHWGYIVMFLILPGAVALLLSWLVALVLVGFALANKNSRKMAAISLAILGCSVLPIYLWISRE